MTKVYLVVSSKGSFYDNYYEHIEKAFFSEDQAVKYKDEYNKKLAEKEELGNACYNCRVFNIEWDSGKSKEVFLEEIKKECERADLIINKGWFDCKSYISIYDEHDARIEVIEVE